MENDEWYVVVVECPAGIIQGCRTCRETLSEGKYLIGIYIRENGTEFRYLLGAPPRQHCGEEKIILMCFETEGEAEIEREKVISHLSTKGTTEGLRLKGFYNPQIN
jgi:hypothetical protein